LVFWPGARLIVDSASLGMMVSLVGRDPFGDRYLFHRSDHIEAAALLSCISIAPATTRAFLSLKGVNGSTSQGLGGTELRTNSIPSLFFHNCPILPSEPRKNASLNGWPQIFHHDPRGAGVQE
jgi:hypothetical protein